jgi:hypothetical protein
LSASSAVANIRYMLVRSVAYVQMNEY